MTTGRRIGTGRWLYEASGTGYVHSDVLVQRAMRDPRLTSKAVKLTE